MKLETKYYYLKDFNCQIEKDIDMFSDSIDLNLRYHDVYRITDMCKMIINNFDNSQECFVAVTYCDLEPANCVIISENNQNRVTIELVLTRNKFQNKGIAFIALKNCTTRLKALNYKEIVSYVPRNNTYSKNLHLKSGFKNIEDITYTKNIED